MLENLGIGILFILILAFGLFFAMLSVMFIFGLPQLYINFMQKIGRRLERHFPKLSQNKKIRGIFSFFLVFSGMAVFVGGIYLFSAVFEWLPD